MGSTSRLLSRWPGCSMPTLRDVWRYHLNVENYRPSTGIHRARRRQEDGLLPTGSGSVSSVIADCLLFWDCWRLASSCLLFWNTGRRQEGPAESSVQCSLFILGVTRACSERPQQNAKGIEKKLLGSSMCNRILNRIFCDCIFMFHFLKFCNPFTVHSSNPLLSTERVLSLCHRKEKTLDSTFQYR